MTNTNPRAVESSYLGVAMLQQWSDLMLWEHFFQTHPVRTVVELGTGAGGFALYLAAQCRQRGLTFVTVDNQKWLDMAAGTAAALGVAESFVHIDLWSAAGMERVASILRAAPQPVVLFCDDGDKPREWRTFGPLLVAGDYVAVHDWPYEFGPQHVGALGVTPIMAAECETLGSITRWFRVLGGTT